MTEVKIHPEVTRIAHTLPPGYGVASGLNHRFQADMRRAERRGVVVVHSAYRNLPGSPGTVYAIVQWKSMKPVPRWRRPALIAATVTTGVFGVGWGVAWLVDTLTNAVAQAAPALGTLAALAFVGLVAGAVRGGRTFSGTFKGSMD